MFKQHFFQDIFHISWQLAVSLSIHGNNLPAGYLSEALEAMTAAKSGLAIRKVGFLWTRNSSGSFMVQYMEK